MYKSIIKEFQKNYQARSNLVNAENGDLIAGTHRRFNRRRDHSGRVLNALDLMTSG